MLFQGDLVIKNCIEMGLEDMRKNPWLIEECFSSLLENPVLRDRYGMKEIARAKEYILNNKIPVFMKYRLDKEEVPCVTIALGSSVEDKSLATLSDQSIFTEEYSSEKIGKPIQYIVKPTEIISYEKSSGTLIFPESYNLKFVSKGMVVVDPQTGNGYIVNDTLTGNRVIITQDTEITANKLGIIPQYQVYRARRERIISQETYSIGCHAHGDPSDLIFLFSVVKYILLRYREGLLEHENFQLSNISCSDLVKNDAFESIGEHVYSRFITLSGQCEESWVKTPMRFIEAIDTAKKEGDAIESGIKILSNKDGEEENNDLWKTIKDE
jgi:hypothetical protein